MHPDIIAAHNKYKEGKLEEAIADLDKHLQSNPRDFDALRVSGGMLSQEKHYKRGTDYLERAMAVTQKKDWKKPVIAETISNLAYSYYYGNDYIGAEKWFRWMCAHDDEDPHLHNRYGRILNIFTRDKDAVKSFEKSIAIQLRRIRAEKNTKERNALIKTYYHVRCNRSMMLLRQGNWLRGWNEFRMRFRAFNMEQIKLSESISDWTGIEPLEGKSIVTLPEQGIGDCFMTVRYVKLLREMGAKIFYFADDRLYKLFSKSKIFDGVYKYGEHQMKINHKVYLFDLPCLFKTTPSTVPSPGRYLVGQSGFLKKHKIPIPAGKLRVGIVWGGNPDYPNDWFRSVPFNLWGPVMEARDDVQFYSIQLGKRLEELEESPYNDRVIRLDSYIKNFWDTACIFDDLDLIITIDTSVAHLAGAMLRPVLNMVPSAPDWRWLTGRNDSVWYPTMRLVRQKEHLKWEKVIEEVAALLKAYDPKKTKPGELHALCP